jgi:hypothetical protein
MRAVLRGCLTENLALISDPVFPHRKDDAKIPLPWTRDFHHDFRCASQIREKIPPASFFHRRAASFLRMPKSRTILPIAGIGGGQIATSARAI